MRRQTLVPLTLLFWPTVVPAQAQNRQALARQVFEAESAFAQTLAARDSQAFAMYGLSTLSSWAAKVRCKGERRSWEGGAPSSRGAALPSPRDPQTSRAPSPHPPLSPSR